MTGPEYVDWFVRLAFTGGGLAAVVAYLRDRKKHNAEGYVAENTRELVVDNAKLANLETRFGLAQRAWDAERASLLARLAHCEEELEEERAENAAKDQKISELEQRLIRVQAEVQAVNDELAELRRNTNGRH